METLAIAIFLIVFIPYRMRKEDQKFKDKYKVY